MLGLSLTEVLKILPNFAGIEYTLAIKSSLVTILFWEFRFNNAICLSDSKLGSSSPPKHGLGLITVTDALIEDATDVGVVVPKSVINVLTDLICLELALWLRPPPDLIDTVSIVSLGLIPSVWVPRKEFGSIVTLFKTFLSPKSLIAYSEGSGITSSSKFNSLPDPNCNVIVPELLDFINRFGAWAIWILSGAYSTSARVLTDLIKIVLWVNDWTS